MSDDPYRKAIDMLAAHIDELRRDNVVIWGLLGAIIAKTPSLADSDIMDLVMDLQESKTQEARTEAARRLAEAMEKIAETL